MYRKGKSQPGLLLVTFIAVQLILAFVPALGGVRLGSFIPVSTLHLPVVLAGALLGPGAGAFVGLISGVGRMIALSLLAVDPLVSPLFTPFIPEPALRPSLWSVLIVLLPPILTGLTAAWVFRALLRVLRSDAISLCLAGAAGSVLGVFAMWAGIFVAFGGALAQALGQSVGQIFLSVLAVNIWAEVAAGAFVCLLPGAVLYHKYVSEN